MSTLYVDRKGVAVRLDGGTLVFEEGGARVGAVPLGPLERVILRGDVHLQASVLGRLGELGIGVVVLTGRKAQPSLLMPRPHNDARRRLAQLRQAQDERFKLAVARELLQRKARAQLRLLQERAEADLMHRYELRTAASRVQAAAATLAQAETLPALRGAEGAAAQAYFAGYQVLFAPSLKFSGRNRRPPRDPVNAVLSLGYTLLHAEAVLQTYAAGLDPFVGFLHDLDFGRESLACDLVEPQRVGVDRLVLRLFRERELLPEHFTMVQGACLLGKAGREKFYRAWEPAVEGLRQALRVDCGALARAVVGDAVTAEGDGTRGDAGGDPLDHPDGARSDEG
ncbi:CRISPR-associated endonuclease Cas1 [Azohydromonas sediminis]|uniref:CRISPR-associated endonuclease Cas1 n=1 Tax=Azohydromonas sediminis TaxID=2259674 RepID=UPI000E650F3D|nr:CRISPR-associated endonuclease Cas1 [Azohydromonas sediminis]